MEWEVIFEMGKVHKSLTERLIFLIMLKNISQTIFQAGIGGFELNLYGFDEAQFLAKRATLFADRMWTIVAMI